MYNYERKETDPEETGVYDTNKGPLLYVKEDMRWYMKDCYDIKYFRLARQNNPTYYYVKIK